jgi:hypothetical protein
MDACCCVLGEEEEGEEGAINRRGEGGKGWRGAREGPPRRALIGKRNHGPRSSGQIIVYLPLL